MDFKIDKTELTRASKVKVTMKAAALLDKVPNTQLQKLPYDQKPYWTIERARIGDTNTVPIELVVNGKVVATKSFEANGKPQDVEFETEISGSAWVTARILPAAHTNPVWINFNNQPILNKESAEWCLRAVQQCWSQKARFIKASELEAARTAYEQAEQIYRNFITQANSLQ